MRVEDAASYITLHLTARGKSTVSYLCQHLLSLIIFFLVLKASAVCLKVLGEKPHLGHHFSRIIWQPQGQVFCII